jgi:hypothetical protein
MPAPCYIARRTLGEMARQAGREKRISLILSIFKRLRKLNVTSTGLSATSLDLSVTSTDLSATSLDLSVTSTDLSATSTDLSATSTDLGATSTDLGATSTDLGATSTDLSATSTNLGATSTDLSATSVDLSVTSAELNVHVRRPEMSRYAIRRYPAWPQCFTCRSETLFYALAVYFGAIRVKRTRQVIPRRP